MSQLQYHPHQSRGLCPKQATTIRPRCPVTGQLLSPREGHAAVVEYLDRKGKPSGKRMSVRLANQVTPYEYSQWRRSLNVQVVHD